MDSKVVLVLGGARSGKSELAERIATIPQVEGSTTAGVGVTYVATGPKPDGNDLSWKSRIEAHRARRPEIWKTIELENPGDLAKVLYSASGTALLDSIGTWVAAAPDFEVDVDELLAALLRRSERDQLTIVVSEEVGLGVHPSTESGQRFRDRLGEVNRRISEISYRVVLVVAGRILDLGETVGSVGHLGSGDAGNHDAKRS